jgi:RNA polymerase sigma-32 factor
MKSATDVDELKSMAEDKHRGLVTGDRSPSEIDAKTPATYDPLRRYLWEINQYKLLTPEEEKELAIRYYTTRDPEAAYRLITANLRLVVKIALDFQRYWMQNLLDLIQEGNIGLMQAIKKFDPFRDTKLSYYASYWIKAYILPPIMCNWELVRIGTTQIQRKLFFNLNKEKDRLSYLGYDPTPKLLAQTLDVKAEHVMEMDQRLSGWDLSLESPVKADSDDEHKDFLLSDTIDVDEELAALELKKRFHDQLMEFRETLKDKELDIMDNRLLADEPLTLQEIGAKYNISRERVRQIQARLLKKIHDYLEKNAPEIREGYETSPEP